ncbi:MAG TPA: hypothetical protein VGM93_01520 [Acidimicrobiales bacterium]
MRTRERRDHAHRRHQLVLAAAAIVMLALVVVLLVSCSHHDSPSGPTATLHRSGAVSVPASTVPPEVLPPGHFFRVEIAPGLRLTSAQRQVVDAYRDAAEAYARATRQPELGGADLHRFWTGNALRGQLAALHQLMSSGEVVHRGAGWPSGARVDGVWIRNSGAAISMCLHDGGRAVDDHSGLSAGPPVPDRPAVLELRRIDGRWTVLRGASNGAARAKDHPCLT